VSTRTGTVLTAAAAVVDVEQDTRTITGLAVPYGPVGYSSMGAVTFARGSIRWHEELGRVKLLRQHDPDTVLGYATDLVETDAGLFASFTVPDTGPGNTALHEAAAGLRDGLSVGVRLDDEVLDELVDKWLAGDTTPTAAHGELAEVSQVSLPAFADARTEGSAALAAAAGGDVLLHLSFAPPLAVSAVAPLEGTPAMTVETVEAPAPAAPAASPAAAPPLTAGHVEPARVSHEPPVYTFDGNGPSFVRDMYAARFDGNPEAIARVQRFNQQWAAQDPGQMRRFLTAAVETRVTEPEFIPPGYRADLLKEAIDKGRPLFSRMNPVTLTDATPFKLPVEGDFVGVGVHTEGTAHVAEGDLTVSDATVTPVAISGAYRLSRELVEATNPAIDQIALRAMMRNYRDVSEARIVAALEASDSTATASINTVAEVRQQIDLYWNTNYESPTAIAAAPSFVSTLLLEVDTTGRPMLPSVGPSNAVGTGKAGETGFTVDGVEIFKVWGVAATMAYLFNTTDVFVGESAIRTFRFEEVEGPGVIKLALWSYVAAAVTRPGSVVKITTT
jgi:HK97 family phage prohead protease